MGDNKTVKGTTTAARYAKDNVVIPAGETVSQIVRNSLSLENESLQMSILTNLSDRHK